MHRVVELAKTGPGFKHHEIHTLIQHSGFWERDLRLVKLLDVEAVMPLCWWQGFRTDQLRFCLVYLNNPNHLGLFKSLWFLYTNYLDFPRWKVFMVLVYIQPLSCDLMQHLFKWDDSVMFASWSGFSALRGWAERLILVYPKERKSDAAEFDHPIACLPDG